jgi:hypothetical protein
MAGIANQTCRREQVLDLLWSDADPEQGRHALRQTVFYLRRRLHDRVIQGTRESLTLGIPVESDHEALLEAVRQGRLEAAVTLYTGEFLPDLAIPGGVEFEHWADVERQRVRSAFLFAARSTVRSWSAAGRHREAIGLARRVRETEGSEMNLRLLLEALIAARDSVNLALEREAIQRTFGGVEHLETSTRALLRASHSPADEDAPERGRESGLVAELVGREAEFHAMIEQWEHTRGGEAHTIRVVAAAGLGKTRLLNDFAARLRATRAQVISLRARPADRLVAYSHVADLAASLASLEGAAAISPRNAAALVDLNPSLSSVFPGREERWRDADDRFLHRVLAVCELIAMVAEEAPVALLIDDHHWADEESRRLIAAVLPRLQHCPVMVVIASRPGYSEAAIAEALRVDLRPLTRAHTAALVSSLAMLPDDAWARDLCDGLHDGSGGSPLMIIESLQSLLERGFLRIEEGAWMTADPAKLMEYARSVNALASRVGASSPEEQQILGTLALYGAPATVALISAATKLTPVATANLLTRLESRGLVAGDGDEWWPAHDLHSESFAEHLTPAERQRIDRELGEQLALGEPDESSLRRSAQHFKASGAPERMFDVFVIWLARHRARGDRASVRSLMRSFDPELEEIARWWRVPFALRFPQWRIAIAGAGLVVLLAMIPGRINRAPVVPPDAQLVVWYDSGGVATQRRVDLFRDKVINDGVIDVTRGQSEPVERVPRRSIRLSPDGKLWATDRVFEDSGGIDVVVADRQLREIDRITSADDDLGPAWSPDGKQIVFVTGRFHPRRWSDLAIYDVATKAVRQLTASDAIDGSPAWNPSGVSIAFERRDRAGGDTRLCSVGVDGSNLKCIRFAGSHGIAVVDWYDNHRVLAAVKYDHSRGNDRDDVIDLVDMNDSLATKLLAHFPAIGSVALSPSRAWVACECGYTTGNVGRWTVFAVDNPDVRAEVVRSRIDVLPMMMAWGDVGRRKPYVDSLSVPTIRAGLPITAALQLHADGVLEDGSRLENIPARWRILEGDAARLNDDMLIPVRSGHVRLRADAEGWRSTEVDVAVRPSEAHLISRFAWDRDLEESWVPFGHPRPIAGTDAKLGAVMLPNGDGSFVSGVMSKEGFSGEDGLAARMRFSARIVDSQWQAIGITFVEEEPNREWMTHPGDAATPVEHPRCGFGAPAGEDPHLRHYSTLQDGGTMRTFAVAPSMTSGEPVELLLQVFPDGSCGLALDGKPLIHVSSGRPLSRNLRLILFDQAKNTRIAIGAVDLFRGVVPSLDWRTVGR